MSRPDSVYKLPEGLPVPIDDGAANHLRGMTLPAVSLPSTGGGLVSLDRLGPGRTVVYCYPRTGLPDQEPPGGLAQWDAIPGTRGCTPQSCSYRDHRAELAALGARVYGLSTQSTAYQKEMAKRLHLGFDVLSDEKLEATRALRLPTHEVAGLTVLRRLTLIVADGRIEECFYPVFPPDADAPRVVAWLEDHRRQ